MTELKPSKLIAAAALQAACETDPADPDHPDTVLLTTGDFEAIVRCAVENYFEENTHPQTKAPDDLREAVARAISKAEIGDDLHAFIEETGRG